MWRGAGEGSALAESHVAIRFLSHKTNTPPNIYFNRSLAEDRVSFLSLLSLSLFLLVCACILAAQVLLQGGGLYTLNQVDP
jgi:hypothetical protein